MALQLVVNSNGTESFFPVLVEGRTVQYVGHVFRNKREARKEGKFLLKVFNFEVQVCGNCEHWKTCRSTEGWRISSLCSHEAGVFWSRRKKEWCGRIKRRIKCQEIVQSVVCQ